MTAQAMKADGPALGLREQFYSGMEEEDQSRPDSAGPSLAEQFYKGWGVAPKTRPLAETPDLPDFGYG